MFIRLKSAHFRKVRQNIVYFKAVAAERGAIIPKGRDSAPNPDSHRIAKARPITRSQRILDGIIIMPMAGLCFAQRWIINRRIGQRCRPAPARHGIWGMRKSIAVERRGSGRSPVRSRISAFLEKGLYRLMNKCPLHRRQHLAPLPARLLHAADYIRNPCLPDIPATHQEGRVHICPLI